MNNQPFTNSSQQRFKQRAKWRTDRPNERETFFSVLFSFGLVDSEDDISFRENFEPENFMFGLENECSEEKKTKLNAGDEYVVGAGLWRCLRHSHKQIRDVERTKWNKTRFSNTNTTDQQHQQQEYWIFPPSSSSPVFLAIIACVKATN